MSLLLLLGRQKPATATATLSTRTGATYVGAMQTAELSSASSSVNALGKVNPEASNYAIGDTRVVVISLSAVPSAMAGAQVQAASLAINANLVNGSSNLLEARVINTAITMAQVSWGLAKTGVPWSAAGAFTSADSTLISTSGIVVAGQAVNFSGPALTAAVQAWLSGTATAVNILINPPNIDSGANSNTYNVLDGADSATGAPVLTVTYGNGLRALIVFSAGFAQVTDAQVGSGFKPIVLVGGTIQQRVTTEGLPIVLDAAGYLRTLKATETLIL
jgi:hypothetical protein